MAKFSKKEKIIVGLGALAIAICGGVMLYIVLAPEPMGTPTVTAATSSVQTFLYHNRLDGTGTDNPDESNSLVLAVMIDNHPSARPQPGLASARVVYEAPVEGGLTRFMALYAPSDTPSQVGPVRSARPYFIDWASEYHALYLHSGGSPEALGILQKNKTDITDVNEFWNGQYFWREPKAPAPHNLFTNRERWQGFITTRSTILPGFIAPWQFAPTPSISISSYALTSVSIPFGPGNTVEWRYNSSINVWERYVDGALVIDPTGKAPVAATTVVVQFTDVKTIDEEGRRAITTVGSGNATVFSGGLMLKGRWSKTAGGRTRFYTAANNEVVFAPGTIWVEVVPSGIAPQITN